ncbi:MAG: hypothetical protein KFB96_00650 [Thiocapsa sp.]|uniref:hypothetical protein n=1 Tax=Thiocapsa sp. TaxID=2024551 RepID=UPI001BD03A09|nr:hypothetical protein [Thiocapsa sp.]QVL49085.1 MAG: hypothetical protein KFB96_00650 [Thiocapsa sp.]
MNAGELEYLYMRIGTAIWHLQYVETALTPFILIKGIAKELNSLEKDEALKHEGMLNKLTLGQLLGKAEEFGILNGETLERLRRFNKERRWLVHNSVRESDDLLYTDSGRARVFSRIEEFIEEAIALHKHIGELVVEYSVSKGMSRRQIDDTAQNQIRRLKGKS